MTTIQIVPINFSDPKELFHRATRGWQWRTPKEGETEEQYRAAFAKYVEISSPEEAKAIRAKAKYSMSGVSAGRKKEKASVP